MRFIRKRATRSTLLAIAALAAFAAIGAGTASAAATLQVTTENNTVRAKTNVTLTTALSGTGTAKKQYGAAISLPASLVLNMGAFGTSWDMCPSPSLSNTTTSLGTVQAFDKSSCPDTAKIGTVTLGSSSGSIYAVSTTPLPSVAVYFDSGVTPYGRGITSTWASNGALTLTIKGLPNTSTSGLSLNFGNPARTGGLPTKVFSWGEPGGADCTLHPTATASVYNWPLIVLPGSTYSTTTATPATLTLNGCDWDFYATTTTTVAGSDTSLRIGAGLYQTGAKQYGQTFDLPSNLWMNSSALGGPQCDASSFANITTGYTPYAQSFTPVNCPTGSIVGTASLGAQTGKIYLVNSSPLPQFGVYFNSGVTPAYGRRLSLDYGALGYGRPQMRIFGLNGAALAPLKLDFTPPITTQTKIWRLAPSGSADCGTQDAFSNLYIYPASGTAATNIGPLTARTAISESGC